MMDLLKEKSRRKDLISRTPSAVFSKLSLKHVDTAFNLESSALGKLSKRENSGQNDTRMLHAQVHVSGVYFVRIILGLIR